MAEKLVKRVVNTPKGIMTQNKAGTFYRAAFGEEVELTPHQAKAKQKHLLTLAEAKANAVAAKAAAEADEAVDEEEEEEEATTPTPPKGAGPKGS